MSNREISEIQRVFSTRLDMLSHILDVADEHTEDTNALMEERLAPDMFPFGTQIAFACNQPRGFAQWTLISPSKTLPKKWKAWM